MRILIIRHADPDYTIDSLTPVGKIEADLLAQRLEKEDITKAYCSPLGRAKRTARPTLKKIGIEAEIANWLEEFHYVKVIRPGDDKQSGCWDILPHYMTEDLYNKDSWADADFIKRTDLKKAYDNVCFEFDKMLEKFGYKRDGINYKVIKPCHDTVALFCHYGVGAVLLSHIMNCSPYVLWQNAVMLPSSVTTVYTEERREGTASLRVCAIGDTSHLYKGGRQPSFAARFCECFEDETRHD